MPRVLRHSNVSRCDRLLDLAISKGLTCNVTELARLAGISGRELYRYLNGENKPRPVQRAKLAKLLGVSASVISAVLESEP